MERVYKYVKVIELSNKVFLTRHWLRWYFVKRGGQEWEPLGNVKNRKRTKPFNLEKTAVALSTRSVGQGASRVADTILDEAAADREVAKNTPN